MFQLSLVDHIRLSFGSVAITYRAHARAAERLASRAWQLRVVTVTLLALATGASLLALTQGGRAFQIATAALTAAAFVAHAVSLSLDFEPRAHAHRASAARLWLLCEKYRALLAEVRDGLIEVPAVTERRDALMREVQAAYEFATPADRETYKIARDALAPAGEGASDEEIDRLLPASLREGGRS
jgi:hypothetical protein